MCLREHPQEVIQQHADVFAALAQRRHLDVNDVEAIVEILAKRLVGDVIDQPAVRCRDAPERRAGGTTTIGADTLNLAGFEEAQEQRLHSQAHLANFVHEDRAAIGAFESAALVAMGVGEAAFDMAEKLGLEQ